LAPAKQVIEYHKETKQANKALLVIQDMTLQKINDTLHTKENGKNPNTTRSLLEAKADI
jgi:hypothetical protein